MKSLHLFIIFLGIDKLLPSLVKDRSPASLIARFVPDNKRYPKPTYREVVRNGINFKLDLSDYMQWIVYFGHSAENRKSLYKLINQNMNVILDVGGNIGETALNFASLSKGQVYTFEPNGRTFTLLQNNIAINSNLIVVPIQKGLSNKNSKMKVHNRTIHNLGADQLSEFDVNSKETPVDVTTIDSFVKDNNLSFVDFIKIDVEGMEKMVLEGGKETILNSKPIIYLEYSESNFNDFGYEGSAVIDLLKSYGYKLHTTDSNKEIKSSQDINYQMDIVAIPVSQTNL